jgi:hypothetical protein
MNSSALSPANSLREMRKSRRFRRNLSYWVLSVNRPSTKTLIWGLQVHSQYEVNNVKDGQHLHLQVGEGVLEEFGHEVCQELPVVGAGLSLFGSVNRSLDLGLSAIGGVDEIEEFHQEHRLCLETSLVVVVRHNKEDVLQDGDEESLEEGIGSLHISLIGNVVDQLQAHV